MFVDLNSPNKLESTLHDVQELFGGQGVEVNQINLLIVILPEFRRSDGMEVMICINCTFIFFFFLLTVACDVLQRKSKISVRTLDSYINVVCLSMLGHTASYT